MCTATGEHQITDLCVHDTLDSSQKARSERRMSYRNTINLRYISSGFTRFHNVQTNLEADRWYQGRVY